jgi:4-amino-4-deoxy-L-arabinose transferase-like glycosyltransferase
MQFIKNLLKNSAIFYILILFLVGTAFCLRTWHLNSVPQSPYWEEVALGYDAFSIFKTGADHHGNPYPIVAFESFGDWKPAGYFYAIVPFIWLFDLTVFSVRLPAALAGVLLVGITGFISYLLQSRISSQKPTRKTAALTAIFLASVSPWLILFSRGGWEANLATAFLYIGFMCGLQVFAKKSISPYWLLGCVVFLVLGMYTYHATRVIAPLFGIILLVWWYAEGGINTIKQHFSQSNSKKYLVLVAPVVLLLLLLPLVLSLGSKQVDQRFAETSIFSNPEPVLISNQLKKTYHNAWWSRVLFHRFVFFGSEIFTQALSHFTLDFLFVSGDSNPRHSVQMVGQMYVFEILAVLSGLYVVLKRNKKMFLFLLLMATAIVLPAAISRAAPHALRTLPLAPLLLSLAAVGWIAIYEKLTHLSIPKLVVTMAIISLYTLFVSQFLHYYFVIYPQRQAHEWQYGYKEVVDVISDYRQSNPETLILLSSEYGRPLMYYWFYTKADPHLVQDWSQTVQDSEKDQSELLSYENIFVIRPGRDSERIRGLITHLLAQIENDSTKTLLLAGSKEYIQTILAEIKNILPEFNLNETQSEINSHTVLSPQGKEIWTFLELASTLQIQKNE